MKQMFLKVVLPVLALSLVIILTFGHLINSFYEQEEWLGLGNVFIYGIDYLSLIFSNGIFKVLLGEGRILSSVITYFFYSVFPFNSVPLTLFATSLHIINSIIVFYLIKTVFKKTLPAFLGSLFFSVNAVSQSAVTWGAAVSTLPATMMLLFSLVTFFKSINFLENRGQLKYRWLIVSFILLYVSILFKQVGIFLIPLYLIMIKLYNIEKLEIKTILYFFKKYILPVSLFLITILVYLITYKSKSTPDALFLTGGSSYFYQTLALRTILYPLTSISQLFVPPEQFLNFARHVTNLYYPFFPQEHFLLIVQTVVLDLLSVILSVMILLLIYGLSKSSVPLDKAKVWFFIVFTLSTFFPYVLISKSFSYLDSRYYYPGVIGTSFIIAWVVKTLWKSSKQFGWIFIVFIISLVLVHSFAVKSSIDKQVSIGQERKNFLSQLTTIKPHLKNNKNVFYITGDSDFYLPGHKVPFQNGMGHTLMVWYYNSGNIPRELIKAKTMFEIGKEGYFEYGNSGFGYFSSLDALKESMSKYSLPSNTVTAFYYDAKSKKLINITDKILGELTGEK